MSILDSFDPSIGFFDRVEPFRSSQRHAANAFDEAQPQHGGYRPQLTDRKDDDFLVGIDEQIDILDVDAPLGMRNERRDQLIDTRISCQWPVGELRKLAIVVAREALVDLAHMFLHDVVVVEQPFPRRADIGAPQRRLPETGVNAVEDLPGGVQPREEPRAALAERGSASRGALGSGECARTFREMLGTEQFSADRAGDQIVGGQRVARKPARPAGEKGRQWSYEL